MGLISYLFIFHPTWARLAKEAREQSEREREGEAIGSKSGEEVDVLWWQHPHSLAAINRFDRASLGQGEALTSRRPKRGANIHERSVIRLATVSGNLHSWARGR